MASRLAPFFTQALRRNNVRAERSVPSCDASAGARQTIFILLADGLTGFANAKLGERGDIMRITIAALGAAWLAAATAFASPLPGNASREQLAAPSYPDHQPWKIVTNASDARHWHKEWIPADQQVEGFKDILSAQAFYNLPDSDPAHFVQRMLAHIPASCDNVSVNGPKVATENGVPVAYGQFYCGQVKGQPFGTHSFIKVIQGANAVYVVNRDFRTPPSPVGNVLAFDKDHAADALTLLKGESAANKYLDAVHLCADTAPPGEHCPLEP